jgi:hypothetical protein
MLTKTCLFGPNAMTRVRLQINNQELGIKTWLSHNGEAYCNLYCFRTVSPRVRLY